MNAAEHAATVRQYLYLDDEAAQAQESLAALVALAERATELETDRDDALRATDEWKGIATEWRERATELERERDAARLIPPLIRQTLEKALRSDMTQPPVTQTELRAAIDLLPDSPSFYSSVSGMEQLAAERERAERAETALREAREWYRDHKAEFHYDEAMWGDPFAISPQLRAALGETA